MAEVEYFVRRCSLRNKEKRRSGTKQQKSSLSSLVFICTGSSFHYIEPSTPFSNRLLTFTDLFKNVRARSGYKRRVIVMDVEPKSDVSICDNATANAHFQSTNCVHFNYLDIPMPHTHMVLHTPNWPQGDYVSLRFQLVMM